MKASRLAALIVILAVLASLAVSALSFAAPDELLVNGGFEEGIEPWRVRTTRGELSLVSKSDYPDCVLSGDYAAKFTSGSNADWIYQVVPVQPGGTYTFSGYAQNNDPGVASVYLRIHWYERADGYGEPLNPGGIVSTQTLTTDDSYHLLTTEPVTAPLEVHPAHSARVECVVDGTPSAIAYFDDMSFEGPPPPTPTPTPTPNPTSTPTPTPTPTPTSTPTPTPSPTATPPISPTPSPSPTPAGTTANRGDVLINEVQYNPPQPGPDASFEWVELFNHTNETIDLEGWRISDNTEYDTIPSLALPPEGFAVIAATEDFYTNFPHFTGTAVFLDDGHIGNGLSNEGDRLILEDSAGTIIDALSYGDDATIMSPPCPKVAAGHSVERLPAGGEFVDNPNPTPGYGLSPPIPTPTAGPTATPTIAPTATSPTPPPEESPDSPGVALRAILIAAALAFFALAFWLRSRRKRK